MVFNTNEHKILLHNLKELRLRDKCSTIFLIILKYQKTMRLDK